jgi:hypothetical protein
MSQSPYRIPASAPRWYRAAVVETNTVLVDIQHVGLLVLSIFAGGVVSYLSSQPTTTIFEALTSWSTAEPLLKAALTTGLIAVFALLKDSIIKPTTPPPIVGHIGAPSADAHQEFPPTPPAAARNERRRLPWGPFSAAAVAATSLLLMPATLPGCTPAIQAIESNVEQVVFNDLANHVAYPQMEQDVAKVLAGQVGVDIVVVLQDAVTFLIDMGILPSSVQPYAEQIKQTAAAKHTAGLTLIVGKQP